MPFGRPVRRSAAAFAMFEEVREETQVDLKSALPHLLARAISWAEAEAPAVLVSAASSASVSASWRGRSV